MFWYKLDLKKIEKFINYELIFLIFFFLYVFNFHTFINSFSKNFFSQIYSKLDILFLIVSTLLIFLNIEIKKTFNNYLKSFLQLSLFITAVEVHRIFFGYKVGISVYMEIMYFFIATLIIKNFKLDFKFLNFNISLIDFFFLLHSFTFFCFIYFNIKIISQDAYSFYLTAFYNFILSLKLIIILKKKKINLKALSYLFIFIFNLFILKNNLTLGVSLLIYLNILFFIYNFIKIFLEFSVLRYQDILFYLIFFFSFCVSFYILGFNLGYLLEQFYIVFIDPNSEFIYQNYSQFLGNNLNLSDSIRFSLAYINLKEIFEFDYQLLFGHGSFMQKNQIRILNQREHIYFIVLLSSYGLVGFYLWIKFMYYSLFENLNLKQMQFLIFISIIFLVTPHIFLFLCFVPYYKKLNYFN